MVLCSNILQYLALSGCMQLLVTVCSTTVCASCNTMHAAYVASYNSVQECIPQCSSMYQYVAVYRNIQVLIAAFIHKQHLAVCSN